MVSNNCHCKTPCPTHIQTTNCRKDFWIANSEVARGMEPYPPEQASPHRDRIPAHLEYVQQVELDSACIALERSGELVNM